MPRAPRGASASDPWPPPALLERLRSETPERTPTLGIVLGSGLGLLADALDRPIAFSAADLPGYPVSTVPGHEGRLISGFLSGRAVWVVQGRVHLYEGHTAEIVTRPVRLLAALGVETLILTNAAGSLDPSAPPGSICLDEDALNLFWRPLATPAPNALYQGGLWSRRGPLVEPWLAQLAFDAAGECGVELRRGVLGASSGPTYETAAEVRAWRSLGATVASMSTVPEALVARELGLRLLIFSLVTNLGTGLSPTPLSHDEVTTAANEAGGRLGRLIAAIVAKLPGNQ